MIFLAYLMLTIGLATGLVYLVLARPTRPWSMASVNANGWVMVACLLYARNLVLVILGGGSYREPPTAQSWFSLMSGFVVDGLVVYRLVSFLRYRRAYRAELAREQSETTL